MSEKNTKLKKEKKIITLSDIWKIIKQNWIIIVSITLGLTVLGIIFAFAAKKNMVVIPEADGKATIKEGLEEDIPAADILQDFATNLDKEDEINDTTVAEPTVTAVSEADLDAETDRLMTDDAEPSVSAAPAKENSNKDNFEYFCDFDDPEPDDEADADLQDARAQLA